MSQTIIPRDEVARRLDVPSRVLVRYESHGLVRSITEGETVGYAPGEVRRIWAIVSYQRELGINLAGVEAVLKLRDHLADVHRRLDAVAGRMREALGADAPDADADA
ncbi:MAG: MerR family transcriptional regulator [Planctomycetia bacterium]|nr:MerR family transcriptional regulator [Planctomycetia bacterium]